MLTTRPYLRTRRPSPTTVEFIVTTRPVLTAASRLVLYTVYLLRVLLGLGIVLLLLATWDVSPYSTSSSATSVRLPHSSSSSSNNSGDDYLGSPPPAPDVLSDDFFWYATYHVLHSTAVGQMARDAAVAAVTLLSSTTTSSALPTATPTSAAAAGVLSWLALPPIYLVVLYYLVLRRFHTEERLLVLRGLGIQTSSTAGTVLGSPVTRFIPTEKIQDVLINEAFRGFEVRHYLIVVVEGEGDVVVVFPKLLPRPKVVEKVWRGARRCLYEQQQQQQQQHQGNGRKSSAAEGLVSEKDGSRT